jgi:hypothetical protein
VWGFAQDLRQVAQRHGLTLYGEDGASVYQGADLVPDELVGSYLELTLHCKDGWLSIVEIVNVGYFNAPEVFPPPDVIDPSEVHDLLRR